LEHSPTLSNTIPPLLESILIYCPRVYQKVLLTH